MDAGIDQQVQHHAVWRQPAGRGGVLVRQSSGRGARRIVWWRLADDSTAADLWHSLRCEFLAERASMVVGGAVTGASSSSNQGISDSCHSSTQLTSTDAALHPLPTSAKS